jgi:hypothetical protein
MAPEDNTSSTGSTEDTSGQEQQGQQQAPTGDTSGNGEQQQAADQSQTAVTKDTVLPDDHPIVKQMKDDKAKLATVRTELTEARAQAGRVTQLENELKERPSKEALETLQSRYDRLEEFLQGIGGPVSKALDSRSFTKALFESDTDVASLIKDFAKANPNATSTALGSAAAAPADKAPDMNTLLRAAIKN